MAIDGVYIARLTAGYIAATAGVVPFGIAIVGSPDFGRGAGWTGIVLGSLGLPSSLYLLVDQESPAGLPAHIVLIIFSALAGWKLISTKEPEVPEHTTRH
jgi:hypothetical protein